MNDLHAMQPTSTTLAGKRLTVVSNVHRLHDCRTFYRQAHFALDRQMDVTLAAIDDGHTDPRAQECPIQPSRSRFRRFLLGWKLAWMAYRHPADVIHFHDPEMLLPMALVSTCGTTPVVYDCHENVVDSIHYKPHIPAWLRKPLAKVTHYVQWGCAKLIGSVVVATEEQLEMFPSSVQHQIVRNFPPQFIQHLPAPEAERPFDLVHCGCFSPERGGQVMLETLQLLVHQHQRTDCRLLLVGVRRDQLDDASRQYIEQHQLWGNIEFRGQVTLEEVPGELATAKIGLMCHQQTKQYRYGVASKLFDYMASGLAIVGGTADFDREYAPEGTVKIYVDETRPQQYADAIVGLLENSARRIELGRNAQSLYQEKYTAEEQADGLMQFYSQLMTARQAA